MHTFSLLLVAFCNVKRITFLTLFFLSFIIVSMANMNSWGHSTPLWLQPSFVSSTLEILLFVCTIVITVIVQAHNPSFQFSPNLTLTWSILHFSSWYPVKCFFYVSKCKTSCSILFSYFYYNLLDCKQLILCASPFSKCTLFLFSWFSFLLKPLCQDPFTQLSKAVVINL